MNMSIKPDNFQQIIDKHYQLMSSYNRALEKTDGNTFLKKFDFEIRSPFYYIKNKKMGLFDFFLSVTFFIQFFSIFGGISIALNIKKTFKTNFSIFYVQRRIVRRIVVFLVKLHIRRQSEKFYELYLRKINTTNSVSENTNLEKIKIIASDLNDFYSIFPSSRQFYATVISIVLTIIVLIEFTKLNSIIYENVNKLIETNIFVLIVFLFLFYVIVMISVLPLVHAFKIKRTIFLDTKSYYHFFDIYLKEAKKIYKKSIYKDENDLYALLGLKGKKLPEFPVDIMVYILLGLGLILFFMYVFILQGQDNFSKINIEKIYDQIDVLISLTLIISWFLLITPLQNYRQRFDHKFFLCLFLKNYLDPVG